MPIHEFGGWASQKMLLKLIQISRMIGCIILTRKCNSHLFFKFTSKGYQKKLYNRNSFWQQFFDRKTNDITKFDEFFVRNKFVLRNHIIQNRKPKEKNRELSLEDLLEKTWRLEPKGGLTSDGILLQVKYVLILGSETLRPT